MEITNLSVKSKDYKFSVDSQTGTVNSLQIPGLDYDLFQSAKGLRTEFDSSENTPTETNIQVIENGPVRITIRVQKEWAFGQTIQDIQAITQRIPVSTFIQKYTHWIESGCIQSSIMTELFAPSFLSGMPGGFQERKTVTGLQINGPIPGHGWGALRAAGNNGGIAVLDDGRSAMLYGSHELNLVFQTAPVQTEFNTAVYPFKGACDTTELYRKSEELCHPLYIVKTDNHLGRLSGMDSFAQVYPQNVVLGSVRSAGLSGGVIMRLWEMSGIASRAEITLKFPVLSADELTLLDDAPLPLEYSGKTVYTPIGPFQVKTVRIAY